MSSLTVDGTSLLRYGLDLHHIRVLGRFEHRFFPFCVSYEASQHNLFTLKRGRREMGCATQKLPETEKNKRAFCAMPHLRDVKKKKDKCFSVISLATRTTTTCKLKYYLNVMDDKKLNQLGFCCNNRTRIYRYGQMCTCVCKTDLATSGLLWFSQEEFVTFIFYKSLFAAY